MRRDSPTPSSVLKVRPLGGCLPEGTPVELNLAREDLIKHEEGTLIWRTFLADGREVAVKMYRRRLMVWCRSLGASFRVRREFEGLSHLEALGIPCSVPVFWSRGLFGPYGWAEMLVTEWVPQSQPLKGLLATRPEIAGSLDMSPLFADIAKMHIAGLHHGILRTKNILLKDYPESPLLVVIDLPRSHRFPRDIRDTRMARYDLMCLCEGLLPYFPGDTVNAWLSAYGMPESKKMDLLVQVKRFRSTGFLRNVAATEFSARNAMALPLKLFLPR
jgi:tRNA A-37 threonylcarbamoyl transferase component Bud32